MSSILFSLQEIADIVNGEWVVPSEEDVDIHFISTDSRQDCRNSLFMALKGENFDAHKFLPKAIEAGAAALCIEQHAAKLASDFTLPVLIVKDTLKAYQQLAKYHRRRFQDLNVIALTGSSGKTSTKEILRAVFNEAYGKEHVYATVGNTNNHVGVPQNLLKLTDQHKIAIIEMGTNHPGEIEVLTMMAEPNAALITTIGSCHLEFFIDLNGVAIEKSTIFKGLCKEGIAVIPNNAAGQEILEKAVTSYQRFTFGYNEADYTISYNGGNLHGSSFDISSTNDNWTISVNWSLTGEHQARNASAATAIAVAMGISPDVIAQGLKNCKLPGMRTRITERDNTTWINDAYNANPDSMKAGLTWLAEFANPEKTLLILGDMLELGEAAEQAHQNILNVAAEKLPNAAIVAVGPNMKSAANFLNNSTIIAMDNSTAAIPAVENLLNKKDYELVFLKASRGTRLEIIEDCFEN